MWSKTEEGRQFAILHRAHLKEKVLFHQKLRGEGEILADVLYLGEKLYSRKNKQYALKMGG